MLGGDHKKKISQLEGYGWAAGFLTFFGRLSGDYRQLLGYIDNTPMLSALVHGYSSRDTTRRPAPPRVLKSATKKASRRAAQSPQKRNQKSVTPRRRAAPRRRRPAAGRRIQGTPCP